MLVEDDEDIRESVSALMREEGFDVLTAEHGEHALRILRAGARPCIIILDLMMPVMDGWQFRSAQLAEPAIASIPVVVLSAATEVRHHAASLGLTEYLVKPVELPTLLNTLERLC